MICGSTCNNLCAETSYGNPTQAHGALHAPWYVCMPSRRALPMFQDGYWSQVGSRPIRPLSTVVLPKGQVGTSHSAWCPPNEALVAAGLCLKTHWLGSIVALVTSNAVLTAGAGSTAGDTPSDGVSPCVGAANCLWCHCFWQGCYTAAAKEVGTLSVHVY